MGTRVMDVSPPALAAIQTDFTLVSRNPPLALVLKLMRPLEVTVPSRGITNLNHVHESVSSVPSIPSRVAHANTTQGPYE